MKNETLKKIDKNGRSWLGTPYFHMAKVKHAGADCALFLACVLRESGIIDFVEDLYYSRTWMVSGKQEMMLEGFERHLTKYIQPGFTYKKFEILPGGEKTFAYKKGDILCMTTPGSVVCHHAAMYFGKNEILHSYQRKGVCITQFAYFWKERLKYVLRILED